MSQRIRQTIIVITGIICLTYLIYRGLFTLNFSSSYAVFASLFLYGAEIYGVTVVLLFFLQVWNTTQPPQQPVLEGRTVEVFVPTYNEDPDLLRTTLRACSLMEYPHRTYLCDDGGTDQRCNDKDPAKAEAARSRAALLKAICAEFGVTYVTRPANQHAKAGNLNYAFDQTDGEFIIIFDADHVPEPHFITRLLGYFADDKLAWVQTPHAFYNFESFQAVHDHKRNLYWEDGALFYEVIQPGRNRWNAPIFAGSAALFRRKALAEVGYIATETITEDMHTGLRMHARGWKSLAISERLVAGQAAPDVTTFHTQRLRWGEGNLSIIAHNNPLTTPGLTIAQRFCYAGSMIHWSGGLFKLGIYLTPLLMLFTGIPPVNRFTWPLFILTVLYVFGSIWGFKLVSHGYGSFWRSELFTMIGFWTQAKGTMRVVHAQARTVRSDE